jgi:hypothetical protein
MKYSFIISSLFFCHLRGNDNSSILTIDTESRNETVISIDSQTHIDYGLAYPITYEFNIPLGSYNLRSYRKFQSNQNWSQIVEKTSDDFFNGIEAVRFDYNDNIAYVSIGFSDLTDSIFIKITDNDSNIIDVYYTQMSQYYDNRNAVVTSTADDWTYYFNEKFVRTCRNFRSFNLWLSCAIVTNECDPDTYIDIQNQLDSGYVEVVSHSRTHPFVPYDDLEGEVLGSKQDLIDNLDLPIHNKYGEHEYIYAWVAPYGEYNGSIDSMVSVAKYLVTRMTDWGEHWFSNWNQGLYKYDPVGVSIEVGSLSYWGSTDTTELNNTFDWVLSLGGIYHLVCHPNILEWDQDFTWVHLEHISNRTNIWYTGFGHLYAYHFLQSTYPNMNLSSHNRNETVPEVVKLYQNYPNPFNPTTQIRYDLPEDANVNITIYDIMGRSIRSLVNSNQTAGYRSIQWNATNNLGEPVSAGMYIYTIQSGEFRQTKKMVLLK